MNQDLRMTVYSALLAALIAAGAYIAIPIGPVPIALQSMFVLLAGLLLGKTWGLCAVAVYLMAGAAGLPVFAGAKGGMAVIIGPTGGYLLSYLAAVFVTGLISQRTLKTYKKSKSKQIKTDMIAAIIGSVIVYTGGVPWLKLFFGFGWSKALALGLYPFILGDGFKVVAAALIAQIVRPVITQNIAKTSHESNSN